MLTTKSVKLTEFTDRHLQSPVIIPTVQSGKPMIGQNARTRDVLGKASRSKKERLNVSSLMELMPTLRFVIEKRDQRLRKSVKIETVQQNGDLPSGASAARSVETEVFRLVHLYNWNDINVCFQMRLLRCVWRGTKKAAGRNCDPSTRPSAIRSCEDVGLRPCGPGEDVDPRISKFPREHSSQSNSSLSVVDSALDSPLGDAPFRKLQKWRGWRLYDWDWSRLDDKLKRI